jgi:N-dimethylarginine dimethylaminohydrolase
MKSFGVKNAYGDLIRVLMHRPGIELDRVRSRNLEEFHFSRPVDREKFLLEYDQMISIFKNHGTEVLFLTELLKDDADSLHYIELRPNMTYTRDLATVFGSGAILMSPFLKGRYGDQRMMARAFAKIGVPVIGSIEPPGFLEGGGVTMIGDDTVVASLCDRANEVGLKQLRNLVLGKDAKYFLEVPLPFGNIHIDGLFMLLDENLCLIHKETLEVFPCLLYEDGISEPRHILFQEFLEERKIQCIPITEEERRGGHLNVVVTQKGKRAVGFGRATRVASEMKKHGWTLDTFPEQELFSGNGGPHCMTCPVLVGNSAR